LTRRHAFALVESLIALVILTIVLFSLAASVLFSHVMALHTLQKEGAYRVGLEALETLEAGGNPVSGVLPYQVTLASADLAEGRSHTARVTWESPLGPRETTLQRVVPRNASLVP